MRYLGIDIGTTFIKGAVLDPGARRLSHIERLEAPPLVGGLEPGFRELEPESAVACVRQLLERLHAHCPDAKGILLCSQLHGMVLCDGQGSPLSRFITWQDQRALMFSPEHGLSYWDALERRITLEDRLALGNERIPGLPLNSLFWFAQRGALPRPDVTPAALPYYVAARLCGCAVVSDVTHAHGHGALDIHTLEWHQPVLEKLGLVHRLINSIHYFWLGIAV